METSGLPGGTELWIIFVPGCLIYFAIMALVCWLVSGCYSAIPQRHRRMEPGAVWLNMIPLFNLVWNFFVYPKLADSFRSFFDEHQPEIDPGTCGRELAMAYAIVHALTLPLGFVPCLGFLVSLAALVLLIIVIVKAFELKKQVFHVTGPVQE